MPLLVLSFVGALLCHLLLFLTPLAGSFMAVDVEAPRPKGEVRVHFSQPRRPPSQGKTVSPSALPPQAEGRAARDPKAEQLLSRKIMRGDGVLEPARKRSGPAGQEERPVLQRAEEAAPVASPAGALAKGTEAPDPQREGVAAAGAGTEAAPLWEQNGKPSYPPLARRRGWQGRVLLEVVVLADGTVESLALHTSSGYTLLDKSAVFAVQAWRFRPARREGVAVASRVLVPIHFILEKSS
ncbi:MAG: energy transducer TonB [Desulfurivibrionaceae bacterium]|nr:energy transducer TonB [Desulfurivibrionaceae bacterium]